MNTQTVGQQDLYDIYGTWHVPFWQTQFFMWSMAILAGIIFLLLLLFLFKKYYKKRSLSASQKALHALVMLAKKEITSRADAQAAYFSLTDILKCFFQACYGLPFESMTDQEMVASLRAIGADQTIIEAMDDLVNSSLSVKYAQEDALQKDLRRHIQRATTVVQRIATHDSKVK